MMCRWINRKKNSYKIHRTLVLRKQVFIFFLAKIYYVNGEKNAPVTKCMHSNNNNNNNRGIKNKLQCRIGQNEQAYDFTCFFSLHFWNDMYFAYKYIYTYW